jgi:hypothetical protein
MATTGSAAIGLDAVRKLYKPKMRPTKMPTTGPSTIPPIMAGICKMVALPAKVGTGIKPNPVAPSMTATAPSIPLITIDLVEKFMQFPPQTFFILTKGSYKCKRKRRVIVRANTPAATAFMRSSPIKGSSPISMAFQKVKGLPR